LAFFATIAVGAPDSDGAPIEKKVFPLAKEGEQWWAGVSDLCELVGARFEGEGFSTTVTRDKGVQVRVWAQIGGKGPYKIVVGEDTYQFSLDALAITKNEEPFGDFVMQPKRIEGGICATLEDLGRILGFAVGGEVDGQPTITHDGKQYRLVKGERHWPGIVVKDGDVIEVRPEDPAERLRELPFVWRGWPDGPGGGVVTFQGPGAYTEHNGLTYRRATTPFPAGSQAVPPMGGMETLYGPVLPGRATNGGQPADLMYLSIVKRQLPTGGVVRYAPVLPKGEPPKFDEQGRPVGPP
jgi:hypothetical protein